MLGKSSRLILYSVLTLSLLFPLAPLAAHTASASTPLTGVIIPLYSYPGNAWNSIIQAKASNPSVPIVAVVNPDNGPGASSNPSYATWITKLQSAGVVVLGYVYTSYAARSIASVESDMRNYKAWYGVQGIFFDEMSNVLGKQGYYSTLNAYATSLGQTFTVGNPGGPVPSAYVGSVSTIIIYENAGAPSLPTLSTSVMGMSKADFAFVAYDESGLSASYVTSSSSYVSYMYLTNATLPNPYSALPSYFSSLVSDLSPSSVAAVTVQSIGPNGQPLVGMWTTVTSDGNTVATGFTPLTFMGSFGQQYSVSVANYGSDFFSHWGDGSTSPVSSFTLSGASTLTAYYAASQQESLSVQSVTTSGAPLVGMWTVIESGGSVVASGFTPLTFYGIQGTAYSVTVSNYQSYVFSHWTSSSTNPTAAVTLSQDASLTAVYST